MVKVILNSYYGSDDDVYRIVKEYRKKNIIFLSVGMLLCFALTMLGALLFDLGILLAKWLVLFLMPTVIFGALLMGCYSYKGILRLSDKDVQTLDYCFGVPKKYKTLPLSEKLSGRCVDLIQYDRQLDVYQAKCTDGVVNLYRVDIDGDGTPDINVLDLNACKMYAE